MEFVKGKVVTVTRKLAGATLIVAASISDTTLFVDDVRDFDEDGGTIDAGGTVMAYTAVDPDLNTLTVPALAAGIAVDTFIAVSPEAPVHTAYVLQDDDSDGDPIPALVPLDKRALLPEGPRAPEDMEAATLQYNGDEWMLLDWEFRHGKHDANTTPIIVTNADGESARVEADGFLTHTNNPVPIRSITGSFYRVATDGVSVYAVDGDGSSSRIRKFNLSTGAESTSGFPISGNFGPIAVDGGFIFVRDGNNDIAKYNASTGASVGSGFPIAGTFDYIAADGGFVYAVDNNLDIQKYNASTGASVGGGFPIAGSFIDVAASDGFVYASASGGALRQFDATTATETVSGFPVGSSVYAAAADGGYVYAVSGPSGDIAKYDAATGEEVTTSGFPLASPFGSFSLFDVVGDYIVATMDEDFKPVRVYNNASDYQSTQRNSSDGSDRVHALTLSDLTATGDVIFSGPADIDNLLITTTKWTRATNQSIPTSGSAATLTYTATEGSATPSAYWSESSGTVTISVAGVYNLNAMVAFAANATGRRAIQILLNGSTSLGSQINQASPQGASVNEVSALGVYLPAGSQLTVSVIQNSGGALNMNPCHFTVMRVGALAA